MASFVYMQLFILHLRMNFKKLLLLVLPLAVSTLSVSAQAIRPLDVLVNTKESYWPNIQTWAASAHNKIEILPADKQKADSTLFTLQESTKTALGAVVHETGGILIDNGWIRILGSGSPKLGRSVVDWNFGKSYTQKGQDPRFLLVADDVLGGFYAVNYGGISDTGMQMVYYFAPDAGEWENMQLTYVAFLHYIFNLNLDEFYDGLRWTNWQKDVSTLDGDKAYACYPYLFTEEAADINKVTRTVVPVQELWDFYFNGKGQIK